MNFIKKAWRGEERLWKVYWIYGTLFSFFYGGLLGLIVIITKHLEIHSAPFVAAWWIFNLVYIVWLLVSEWRCAFNADWVFWGYVVRVLVALAPLFFIGILLGGVLVGQDLIKAAECRKALAIYTQQGGTDPVDFKNRCYLEKGIGKRNTGVSTPALTLAPPPPPIPGGQSAYALQCIKSMTDTAKQGGIDPQQYIDANQPYLHQCIQYYTDRDSAK